MPGELLPSYFPEHLPQLSGPTISISATRKVVDAAASLAANIEAKVKKSIADALADAGKVGAAAELKVSKRIGDLLSGSEQLLDEIGSLVQNSIAGAMAPAVVAVEDINSQIAGPVTTTASAGSDVSPVTAIPTAGSPATVSTLGSAPAAGQEAPPLAGPPAPTIPGGGPIPVTGGSLIPIGGCPSPTAGDVANAIAIVQAAGANVNPDPGEGNRDYRIEVYTTGCVWPATKEDFAAFVPPAGQASQGGMDWYGNHNEANYLANAIANLISYGWIHVGDDPTKVCCQPVSTKPPTGPPHPPITPPPPPPPPPCPTSPCTIDVTCPTPPPCPPLKLPDCLMVDLCDWDKLCDILKRCLKQATSDDCALGNDTAYTFKDCGTYGEAQRFFLGSLGSELVDSDNIDTIAVANVAEYQVLDDTDFPSSLGVPY